MPRDTKQLKQKWSEDIAKALVGKKIKSIGYLTDAEVEQLGWYSSAVVIELDDGTCLFPSQDDEGNGAGSIFTTLEKLPVLPVI